jgi:hypothetical protein
MPLVLLSLAISPEFVQATGAKANVQQTKPQAFHEGKVDYGGVRFTHDKSLASGVTAKVVEAQVAEAGNPVPADAIYPTHLIFELAGTYPSQPASFIASEIHIYSVSEYKQAFAKDPKAAREVSATITRLRQILRSGNARFTGEVPLLPLPDGYLVFRAHTRFLRFKQGSGIVFLTQGQQDEMPINNQNLSYEFEGLTNDGRYYVTAEFPVAAPFLAYDREKASYDASVKESSCYECPEHARFMREYRAYARSIGLKLERLPAEQFKPSLKLFDELITSIEVDANADQLIKQP